MQIETLVVGQLKTNCYLVFCQETRETLIIDPGDDGDFIINRIRDLDLEPKAIVATHGHFDHVLAVTELKLTYQIPFYLHKKDLKILKRAQPTARYFLDTAVDPVIMPDKFLKEGNKIKFGREVLKVLEIPGHTEGSISLFSSGKTLSSSSGMKACFPREKTETPPFKVGKTSFDGKKHLFVGDTIFAGGSYGRTDLEGGDSKKVDISIKRLLKFPKETIIYPGHGEQTTVAAEIGFWQNNREL